MGMRMSGIRVSGMSVVKSKSFRSAIGFVYGTTSLFTARPSPPHSLGTESHRRCIGGPFLGSYVLESRMPVLPSLKVGKYRRFRIADIDWFLRLCEPWLRTGPPERF